MHNSFERDSAGYQPVNSSYDEGRFDKPFTPGGDWNEHMRGRADKDRWNTATGSQQKASTGSTVTSDGRAGNFWGKLILFLVGLLLAVPSFFTAILAGTVLFLLVRSLSNPETIDMKRFYTGAFWGMFAYLATAAVLSFFIPLTNHFGMEISSDFYIQKIFLYFSSIFNTAEVPAETLMKFHLPCLLVAAIVVNVKMGNQLGRLSFLKALVVVAVILVPSFMGLLYLMEAVLPAQLQYFVTLV